MCISIHIHTFINKNKNLLSLNLSSVPLKKGLAILPKGVSWGFVRGLKGMD
jgi:hypothetical protein